MWITRISINNPVFATMVMVALCVLGLFAYTRLSVEHMPDISMPTAFVDVSYPGASAEAVERELTKPIEQGLNTIAGVRRITSRSLEGRSQTMVEFGLDTTMTQAMQELRDRVTAVQVGFPRDAKPPLISRQADDNAQPVVSFALLSKGRGTRELSVLGEKVVATRMQRVDGVARVEYSGLAAREVRIDLDPARLRAYGITGTEISSALKEANSDLPVGLLSDALTDSILRVENRVREARDFAGVVVARRDGLALRVGDLGRVTEREQEATTIARVNGQPAINFAIYKQQDANVVATGAAVKAALAELRPLLPADVELVVLFAASDFVRNSLNGVIYTLVEGALLTVAIVFLFLHSWRSTVITGLTLPISVISSFIAVYAFGFTLNFMTMMALSLCIGLLIDDAIVVRENIVRHLQMGKSHHTAAREGTEEIGLAVMATTFAICAVFVPVAFMGGIVGKFFFPFGITVVVAVMVSLFVSFTLDPMLSSIWKDPPSAALHRVWGLGALSRWTNRRMDALQSLYARVICWAFSARRYRLRGVPCYARPWAGSPPVRQGTRRLRWATLTPRGVVLAAGFGAFAVSLALTPLVGTEFIPQTDQSYTQIGVRLPMGSSLERSDAKARQIEALVAAFPEVRSVATTVGAAGAGFATGRNQAMLSIGLVPTSERRRTQKEVEDAIRARIARVPGVEVSVGFNRPIYVAILGSDAEGLARITTEFAEKVRRIPGIADLEVSVKPGLPAFAVRLNATAVRELGATAPQLAGNLRVYVNGDTATHWTTPNGDQVEVTLRLPREQREHVEQMRGLPVAFARDGTPIALDTVATITPVLNPDVIRRQNLQRREALFAGVKGRPAGDVGADVQKLIRETRLPPGYSFDIGGSQTQQQNEAFAAMLGAMLLAAIFIYIVLASQFGSFLQPLAIMASLPLALFGVVLALLLWRSTLNVFSMIGLVMLMGLVTKNAILLVDFANQARAAGASMIDALLQAGLVRMRPIIMTTAAMVFGMLPLALALNEGGELQAPMGRAIIGGVLMSTLLTLVVVPVIYSYVAPERKLRPS